MNKSQKSRARKVIQHLDKAIDFGHRAIGELPRDLATTTDHRLVIQECFGVIERVQDQLRTQINDQPNIPKPDEGQGDIEDVLKATYRPDDRPLVKRNG